MWKKCQISTRPSNSNYVNNKPTNFSYLIFLRNPPIFPTSFFEKPTNFSYLIFLGNPPISPTSFSWETHQFFQPHFLGNPTNFFYLIFLGNRPIFPTSLFWGYLPIFLSHFFGKLTNFSYLIFLGNPPIWLMKLLKKLHLMRFLATIFVTIWNFWKLFTMKEDTIDTYKNTPPLLSYLIRMLRNLSLNIWSDASQYLRQGVFSTKISRNLTGSGI